MKKIHSALILLFTLVAILSGCGAFDNSVNKNTAFMTSEVKSAAFDLNDIPEYSGKAYAVVNNNVPYFSGYEHSTKPFEEYSPLDDLGRCGVAYANICREIMPTEERGAIGQVKPTGWHTVKYDSVDGKYLYNRCHLIGYRLSAENANECNLITGTRYLNVEGMMPFENLVADYVNETNNHVMYRVTPIFEGNNLLATGVLMEAYSVEDDGYGICFNVFCYNVQPGITINYSTGDSSAGIVSSSSNSASTAGASSSSVNTENNTVSYIGNSKTKKFHKHSCVSVGKVKDSNKVNFSNRDEAINKGYVPCENCKP